jgi:hypothetical protein
MARDRDHIEFDGEVIHKTERAVLFWIDDLDEEVWFPLSEVELSSDETSLLVPQWLARSKGLD